MNPTSASSRVRSALASTSRHVHVRALSSSSSSSAAAGAAGAGSGGPSVKARPWAVQHTPKYQFDDPTSLGWMRMFRIQEGEGLVRKVEEDREVLRAANKHQFTPPTSSLRLTSSIDLSSPSSRFHTKSTLLLPVAALPLNGADAIHRFKLLAGARWSPGRPGREEFVVSQEKESTEGKEGWFKMSEERFGNQSQNRRSVSDMLERLVNAANDPNSPLPAHTPLDTRHLLARQRKKRSRPTCFSFAPSQEFLPRRQKVGGVKGFPIEWLSQEHQAKVKGQGGKA